MVSHIRKIRSRYSSLLEEQSDYGKKQQASLFQRLANEDDRWNGKAISQGIPGQIDSIKQNLRYILNANFGSCKAAPCLGLQDLNDNSDKYDNLGKAIAEDIRRNILKYEPRVSSVDVKCIEGESPLSLAFAIELGVSINNKSENLIIDIILENGSHCRIL